MKPQLGSTLTRGPKDRRKHTKVKHSHILRNMLHATFKILRNMCAHIKMICSSGQKSINNSESIAALICEQRKEEAVQCDDSKIQIQQHIRPRLTSTVFVKLSSNACLDNPQR